MSLFRHKAGEALANLREFSFKINKEQPEEPLVQGLNEHVRREVKQESEGKRLYSESVEQTVRIYRNEKAPECNVSPSFVESSELNDLNDITKELEDTWKDAIKEVMKKRKGHSEDLAELIKDPTADKLKGLVRAVQDELEAKKQSKGGRVKEWFRKVAARISNHQYLLEMLPSGDKYTSILIGGLTACINATLEHEEIAELISDCLEKLSDKTHKLFQTIRNASRSEYIKAHIIKFYSNLFGLLIHILQEWQLSRAQRWKNSFGSSFRNRLQSSIESLDYHIKELSDENNSIILNEVREGMGALVQAFIVGSHLDSKLGTTHSAVPLNLLNYISGVAAKGDASQPISLGWPRMPDAAPVACEASKQDRHDDQSWATQTILEDTAWMTDYVSSEREASLLMESSYLSTNAQVYHRLLQWTTSISSEALWLEGPETMGDISSNALTTAFIVDKFRKLRVPVISYFCYYNPKDYRTFSRPQELLKMVYALISQMVRLVPSDLSSALDSEYLPDLSPARIRRLSTDLNSLPDAIGLLSDLLPLGPSVIACCVDGLQILDFPEEPPWYQDCLKKFIEVLATTKPPHPRIRKLWLSTDGHSWALQEAVTAGWIEANNTNSEDDTQPLALRAMDVAGAT
ncbi:uncharacterized protein Aud_006227 [Aspergillus udagawae]|uniref:DUF7708 domain-containing protein n=1 Tax=Aspergillus udagawae TaxID=91492 RepID=A0A8E0QRJ3_9EURO|nr:uncharacterized protein Aud_006227 [Aspergillus udagawae]GIC89799.1 hypothetical protein Aud_006227 [Aspergillus udagawae]